MRWRRELNNLGKQIGVMTTDEINKETNRLSNFVAAEKQLKKLNTSLPSQMGTQRHSIVSDLTTPNQVNGSGNDNGKSSPNVMGRSRKTGRFNETRSKQTSGSKKYLNNRLVSSSNKYILCNLNS